MDPIDFKIIESIRAGSNDKALSYLYDKPLRKIRKHILRNNGSTEDANDIFQDAVLILFYQIKKDKYNTEHNLDSFLYAVAKNLWIDKIRREKKMFNKNLSKEQEYSDLDDQLKNLISKEKTHAFKIVFQKLDDKCQQILQYAIFDKLSMNDISAKMGYTNGNVAKSTHYRCKQYLMRLIKADGELLNLFKN